MPDTKTPPVADLDEAEFEIEADQQATGQDVAAYQPQSQAVAPAGAQAAFNAHSMLAMVRELALDERVDAGKLETVMRVANQQQDREREIEFYQDKNRAVREMPQIRKDGRIVILDKNNPSDLSLARVQGHFERWADVQQAITPVLTRHNMTLTHKVDHADGHQIVIAVLTHDNGYREESGPMRLPLDTSGGKNNVQGAGSSQTYGLRYTTRAICGLRFENAVDDDGALTAMPDEPLNDQQARRLEEAQRAFERGPEAYEQWFGSIPPIDRKWLIQSGRHAEFGGKALPGALPKPASAPAASPPADGAAKRKGPTMTPKQWALKYESDLAAITDLADLAQYQAEQRTKLDALKARDPALYDDCVAAGTRAFNRLSGNDQAPGDSAPGDDLFGAEGK